MTTTHGFELLRDEDIPELRSHALLYRHVKTGAELLSLDNDDENKCFGVASARRRPTPPASRTSWSTPSSAARASIPLKDPFVELIKGSLQTFLNAITFADKTCYPVASTNLQDFYNLVDVYLDTVFYPRLARETFVQQGWHYELDSAGRAADLQGRRLQRDEGRVLVARRHPAQHAQQSLFPDNTYGVDSGGDPRHIPDLTYEQFVAFHHAYYHPSNPASSSTATIPEERLRLLDGYLSEFERRGRRVPCALAAALSRRPRRCRRFTPGTRRATTPRRPWSRSTGCWPRTPTRETTLALSILSHALVGTPAAPLRKALIDSGLGEALTPAAWRKTCGRSSGRSA